MADTEPAKLCAASVATCSVFKRSPCLVQPRWPIQGVAEQMWAELALGDSKAHCAAE